jgi:hypothetical protein
MERPSGLLGQLWDRFGPVASSAIPTAIAAVVIEAAPKDSPRADDLGLGSSVRTASLSAPVPPTPATSQENPALGSVEDLERYLNETSSG